MNLKITQAQWEDWRHINKDDAYGSACFRDAGRWASAMDEAIGKGSFSDLTNKALVHIKSEYAGHHSGMSIGITIGILVTAWRWGDEFGAWWRGSQFAYDPKFCINLGQV